MYPGSRKKVKILLSASKIGKVACIISPLSVRVDMFCTAQAVHHETWKEADGEKLHLHHHTAIRRRSDCIFVPFFPCCYSRVPVSITM